MTKKYYVAIARIFLGQIETASTPEVADTLKLVAREIAGVMANDNPRFDRDRFLIAAGVQR